MGIRETIALEEARGGVKTVDAYPAKCSSLGLFQLKDWPGRGWVLRQTLETQGTFSGDNYLEVMAGPP